MIKELLEGFLGESHESHEFQLKFNCPRCAEENTNTPDNKYNLEINLANDNPKYGSDKIFNCWKCNYKSGSLDKIIREYGSKQDYTYYKDNSLDNLLFEKPINKKFRTIYLPKEYVAFKDFDLKNSHHLKAYDYLINKRKISVNTINYFNIGACFNGYYKNRIIIPSYDKDGEINSFIGRIFIDEKPTYLGPSVDKDNIIYNEKNINWNLPVFLVEGWFDLFALPINTIPLNGKKILSKLFLKIKEYKPPLILLFDPDAYNDMEESIDDLTFLNLPFLEKITLKNDDLAKNYQDYGKSFIKDITKNMFS